MWASSQLTVISSLVLFVDLKRRKRNLTIPVTHSRHKQEQQFPSYSLIFVQQFLYCNQKTFLNCKQINIMEFAPRSCAKHNLKCFATKLRCHATLIMFKKKKQNQKRDAAFTIHRTMTNTDLYAQKYAAS